MTRCILHVGMNKTGSSAIQNTAAANRDRLLAEHDVEYLAGPANHSALGALFVDDPLSIHAMHRLNGHRREATERWCVRERARLHGAMTETGAAAFMISGEGLSTIGTPAVHRLRDTLRAAFDPVDVFIYVREPFGYAVSKAQQNVKAGITFARIREANLVDPVAAPREADGRFSPAVQPFYRQRIEPLRDAFGVERVHVRAFEPSGFAGGDVVRDFFAWAAGIDLSPGDIAPVRANESMDAGYVGVLEAVNRIEPPFRDGRRNLARARDLVAIAAGQPARTPFAMPDFDFDRFAEVVAGDVAWLAEATHGRIAFDLEHPLRRAPPVPETDHSAVAAVLNAQALLAENNGVRMQVNRALANLRGRAGDERKPTERVLQHLLRRCREPLFLLETAALLNGTGAPDLAGAALERVEALTDEPAMMERVAATRERVRARS